MKHILLYGAHLYALSILRPLQQAARERGVVVGWFLLSDLAAQRHHYMHDDERVLETVQAVREFAPEAVFATTNTVPDFFPGLKVQLFHGFNARKRSERKGHFRLRGCFDLYCTQGPDTTVQFTELARVHGYFDVVQTGWAKMDPLFQSPPTDDPLVPDTARKTILFASTFTPRLSAAHRIAEEVRALVHSGRWRWICNLHPKMDPEVRRFFADLDRESDDFSLIETDDILPLLRQADIMLADTSSIISEFLLLHKPVVTFDNQSPGDHLINVTDPDQLGSALDRALCPDERLLEAIGEYAARIHPYRDGRSSDRILDATIDRLKRGDTHLKTKPLNLYRRLKLRQQLRWYHWA